MSLILEAYDEVFMEDKEEEHELMFQVLVKGTTWSEIADEVGEGFTTPLRKRGSLVLSANRSTSNAQSDEDDEIDKEEMNIDKIHWIEEDEVYAHVSGMKSIQR